MFIGTVQKVVSLLKQKKPVELPTQQFKSLYSKQMAILRSNTSKIASIPVKTCNNRLNCMKIILKEESQGVLCEIVIPAHLIQKWMEVLKSEGKRFKFANVKVVRQSLVQRPKATSIVRQVLCTVLDKSQFAATN